MMADAKTHSVYAIPPHLGNFQKINGHNAKGLRAVLLLARRCNYDRPHAHRVARIATRLFEELRSVHGLNHQAKYWLIYAAILHDIAKRTGADHHKAVLQIVLKTPHL